MKIYRSDDLFVGFGWGTESKNTKCVHKENFCLLLLYEIYVVDHKEKRFCCEGWQSLPMVLLTIFVYL